VSQIFTCGLSDLLLLAVGSLVVFVLREYILKVLKINYAKSEILAFLNKLLTFFLQSLLSRVKYTNYSAYSCEVTVAEWLDGSFENQNRLSKAQQ
jgi:hypothetical protein